jgi:transposase
MPKQPNDKRKRKNRPRRDWEEGLPELNRNAAGIDVGNAEHYVAVPAGRDPEPVQSFGSFTPDLHRMAQWLKACSIETVVMQATGVYWNRPFPDPGELRISGQRGEREAYKDAAGT